MDLESQIGQMLMVGFRGTSAETGDSIVRDVEAYGVGSVVLFDYDVLLGETGRNIESLDQVKGLVGRLQQRAERPLLICVDQEGGQVCRMKETLGFPQLASAQSLGALDDLERTSRGAQRTAQALSDLGINFNLAPVVDVNLHQSNPVIGAKERSFSADPEVVVRHARAFIDAHREAGVACALKHFPGHGSSLADSHLGMADVTDTWSSSELDPYRQLIGEGAVDAVMTAHVYNRDLDPNHPATLSKSIIGDLLRDQLHFQGVVVSDDMQMGAVANFYGLEEALRLAITAGVDLIALANNTLYERDIVPRSVSAIVGMVEDGRIPRERIESACSRIARLRADLETQL